MRGSPALTPVGALNSHNLQLTESKPKTNLVIQNKLKTKSALSRDGNSKNSNNLLGQENIIKILVTPPPID